MPSNQKKVAIVRNHRFVVFQDPYYFMSKKNLDIVCYVKTFCGWSEGVRSIMRKYDLSFEEKDIIKNPAFRWEMEQKSCLLYTSPSPRDRG